jgi:hypothetical protein
MVCTFWIVLMCWCQKWFLKNKKNIISMYFGTKFIWKATATTLPNILLIQTKQEREREEPIFCSWTWVCAKINVVKVLCVVKYMYKMFGSYLCLGVWLFFKVFFIWKCIKIIYIFIFFKIIFDISTSKWSKNTKNINLKQRKK